MVRFLKQISREDSYLFSYDFTLSLKVLRAQDSPISPFPMALLSPWFCCKSFLRLRDHTRLVEYNQLDCATKSLLQYQPPQVVSQESGGRSSRPDELSLSRSFIAADSFPCRTSFEKNFGYVLDRPSFLRVYKLPLYKPHLFKQQIKVPSFPES